jgi:hypothetical protein
MMSSNGYAKDTRDVRIEYGKPAYFDGILVSEKNYRQYAEDIESCEIWKKNFIDRPPCKEVETSDNTMWMLFVSGVILGFVGGKL